MKLLEHRIVLPSHTGTVTLIPFGCVHVDEDRFEECLTAIATTPHCYAIGLGDYKSFARTHYRNHIRAYRADEDSQRDMDNLVEAEAHKFYTKYLKRIQGKLWGLAEGNHHWQFQNGTTDTQLLCKLAGVPYLEKGSLHRLAVIRPDGRSIKSFKILVHHGDWGGGAQTIGGDVNSLVARGGAAWDVDVVIAGHTHRKFGYAEPILTLSDHGALKVVERPKAFIRAGCFTKGYLEGCVTYAERRLMKPTTLGYVTLRIEFFRRFDKAKYLAKRQRGKSADAARNAQHPVEYRFGFEQ